MRRKTPQEKKRESYLRDRRNTYGENDKSSRKNIPRSKRRRSRMERRLSRTAFPAGAGVDVERVEEVESRRILKRRRAWTKCPDEPLASALEDALRRRVDSGMLSADQVEATLARIREVTARDY
jgi:hypothetical protein